MSGILGSVFIAFIINQGEGSSYGNFTCPCGGDVEYKITEASGGCTKCDAMYFYTGGSTDLELGVFSDFYIELERDTLIDISLDDFTEMEKDKAIYNLNESRG